MKLVFIGYMASGKSSIGRIIAKKVQIPFIDLDDFIEKKENLSIVELFKTKGEIYFRKKETQFLEELLKNEESFVLALGGGTPCYGKNIDLVNEFSTSVYLKSSLQNTYTTLSKSENKESRPLIASIPNDKLKEFIAKHLFERTQYYQQAQHSVLIDNKGMEEIAEEILIRLEDTALKKH
ncbi:shikimate kinase [Aureibaculum luteum]|uniref:shikimate kinase n=1 Tax=Aureibaculum luteum TaxID=1548456 RepID=UPI000E4FD1EF|nr:shikimate kinase [Aureibaculum luteum]